MGAPQPIRHFMDRLANVLTGQGTTIDRRTWGSYVFVPIDPSQAEAAYRTSWLVRKIVDVPPFDMTRARRDWQAESADIEAVEKEERRLQLWPKLLRANILARLYGGGALVLGTTDRNTEQPLDAEKVGKEGLRYIHVMSRHQLAEGQPRLDPEDPWFGYPDFFSINTGTGQQVRLHPSRVIAFIGQKAPEGALLATTSWFWGDPVMQSIGEAVKNADLAQAGFASLVDEAKLDILRMPELTAIANTPDGEARILRRLAATNAGKSVHRALILDKEDEWDQRQVTWTGIPDVMMAFLQVVAGAADIPLTRLLGTSPKGLQSTGDGEERDYHSMVLAKQDELLTPALDRIDPLLIRSALGSHPSDIYYEYADLTKISEKDAAEIESKNAETIKKYADTGLLPDAALAKIAATKMQESGRFPGSEKAFEEHKEELEDPDTGPDPSELLTREAGVKALEKTGKVKPEVIDQLFTDASPRSLYVCRKVENVGDLKAWAKSQGIPDLADELHVTIAASRTPIDWIKAGNASDWSSEKDGKLTIAAGGPRVVEPLGGMTAVLMFASSALVWRNREILRAGATSDFDEYMPHISLTKAQVDVTAIEPYRGKIVLGPEIFDEFTDD